MRWQAGDNLAMGHEEHVGDRDIRLEGDDPTSPSSDGRIRDACERTHEQSIGRCRTMRGTYAGLIERIPYLVDLGITAVELLPVFQFDAQTVRRES